MGWEPSRTAVGRGPPCPPFPAPIDRPNESEARGEPADGLDVWDDWGRLGTTGEAWGAWGSCSQAG